MSQQRQPQQAQGERRELMLARIARHQTAAAIRREEAQRAARSVTADPYLLTAEPAPQATEQPAPRAKHQAPPLRLIKPAPALAPCNAGGPCPLEPKCSRACYLSQAHEALRRSAETVAEREKRLAPKVDHRLRRRLAFVLIAWAVGVVGVVVWAVVSAG